MKIYDETKTNELTDYDLETGYLKPDKLIVHHEAVTGVEGAFHYETIAEYPNGGKDVKKVWDVEPVQAQAAYDETVDIHVYIPYTADELTKRAKDKLRARRAAECFPVINRGQLWYDKLTAEQRSELSEWYEAWLDVTETMTVPEMPGWIKQEVKL